MTWRTILIAFFLLLTIPMIAQAQPSLVMPQSKVTLADPVRQGHTARGEFTFTNQGDSELEIKSVTPG